MTLSAASAPMSLLARPTTNATQQQITALLPSHLASLSRFQSAVLPAAGQAALPWLTTAAITALSSHPANVPFRLFKRAWRQDNLSLRQFAAAMHRIRPLPRCSG